MADDRCWATVARMAADCCYVATVGVELTAVVLQMLGSHLTTVYFTAVGVAAGWCCATVAWVTADFCYVAAVRVTDDF